MGQGAPSRAGEGIDRDAGIGPPLSCERVRGGAGGPAPLLRRWREPFSEKPKPPRTFKSVASASSAIPAYLPSLLVADPAKETLHPAHEESGAPFRRRR